MSLTTTKNQPFSNVKTLSNAYQLPSLATNSVSLDAKDTVGFDGSILSVSNELLPKNSLDLENLVNIHRELQGYLDNLADTLRSYGRYDKTLELKGGFSEASNPLCRTVILAPDPDTEANISDWQIPALERRRIDHHSATMLKIADSKYFKAQHEAFCCFSDSDWEVVSALHEKITAGAQELLALLKSLEVKSQEYSGIKPTDYVRTPQGYGKVICRDGAKFKIELRGQKAPVVYDVSDLCLVGSLQVGEFLHNDKSYMKVMELTPESITVLHLGVQSLIPQGEATYDFAGQHFITKEFKQALPHWRLPPSMRPLHMAPPANVPAESLIDCYSLPLSQQKQLCEQRLSELRDTLKNQENNSIDTTQVQSCISQEIGYLSALEALIEYEETLKQELPSADSPPSVLQKIKEEQAPKPSSNLNLKPGDRYTNQIANCVVLEVKNKQATIIWDSSLEVEEVELSLFESLQVHNSESFGTLGVDDTVVISQAGRHFGRLAKVEANSIIKGASGVIDVPLEFVHVLRKAKIVEAPFSVQNPLINVVPVEPKSNILQRLLPGYESGALTLEQAQSLVEAIKSSANKLQWLADIAIKKTNIIRVCVDLLERAEGFIQLGFKSMTELFKSGILGYSRSNLQKQWQAAHVEVLLNLPVGTLPEDHCRKLNPLVGQPGLLQKVYEEAQEKAKEQKNKKLTAKLLASCVAAATGDTQLVKSKSKWRRNGDGSRHYYLNLAGVERQMQQDAYQEECVLLEELSKVQNRSTESLVVEGLLRLVSEKLGISEQGAIALAIQTFTTQQAQAA